MIIHKYTAAFIRFSIDHVMKSSEENSAFTFLQVDFESLQSINPEVIAWIQIPALDISYPVAKGTDNAYFSTCIKFSMFFNLALTFYLQANFLIQSSMYQIPIVFPRIYTGR